MYAVCAICVDLNSGACVYIKNSTAGSMRIISSSMDRDRLIVCFAILVQLVLVVVIGINSGA